MKLKDKFLLAFNNFMLMFLLVLGILAIAMLFHPNVVLFPKAHAGETVGHLKGEVKEGMYKTCSYNTIYGVKYISVKATAICPVTYKFTDPF